MKLIVFLLALLLPAVAWGVDGDSPCVHHSSALSMDNLHRGVFTELACIQICDDKDSSDSSCFEDLAGTAATYAWDFGNSPGTPDLLVFEWQEDPAEADCSVTDDMTMTITTSPDATGVPSYALDSTAVALNTATNRVILDLSTAPVSRYLHIALSNVTACDNVDLYMHMLVRQHR